MSKKQKNKLLQKKKKEESTKLKAQKHLFEDSLYSKLENFYHEHILWKIITAAAR